VKPLDFTDSTGKCINSPIGTTQGSGCNTLSLEQEIWELQRKLQNATGTDVTDLEMRIAELRARVQDTKFYGRSKVSAVQQVREIANSSAYKNLDSNQRTALWEVLNLGMEFGLLGGKDLKEIAQLFKHFKPGMGMDWASYMREITTPSLVGVKLPSYVQQGSGSSGNLLAQGASFGASFIPVIGDGLGVATAILGFDVITGEPVEGVFRWLGLLGLIGLAEVATSARAARAGVTAARAELSIARKIVKGCANSFSSKTKVWTLPTDTVAAQKSTHKTRHSNSRSSEKVRQTLAAVAITSVVVGASVVAFNEKTRQNESRLVTATITQGEKLQPIVRLSLETSDSGTEVLETTLEHPFAVRAGQDELVDWVNAVDLRVGQSLARKDGKSGRVASVVIEARHQQMYNLSVEAAETYYVGESQWLVHNASSCAWTSPAGVVYDLGSKEGNRVSHVFEHLAPDASKTVHTVFNVGNSSELIPLIDDAWSARTSYTVDPNTGHWIYDVPMGQTVGTAGETTIRIVVRAGTSEIITTFPR
jgi:Pretoxin HINT domain/Pre-toxin TG